MPDTIRDILLAFVRVHILHHAVSERIYGSGMAEELARHGYKLSPGTLYPLPVSYTHLTQPTNREV